MLIIAAIAAALVLVVALAAAAASRKVLRAEAEEKKRDDDKKAEEWARLASRHDPEKGYAEAMAGSDAYRAMTSLGTELKSALRGSMQIDKQLPDADSFEAFELETGLLPEIDMDERRQYADWSDERAQATLEYRSRIDKACVMAATSQSEAERTLCMKEAERIYGMLDTGITVHLSAPAADGVHTLRKDIRISRNEVLRLAGREEDPDGNADAVRRYHVLQKAGFRCCRCGRSPLVGVSLYVRRDGLTGQDECLCGDCGGGRG